jgi:glycosyltransferase involved in cell wall biosynthesis
MTPNGEVAEIQPRKRVLYLITKTNFGGAQRYVHDLALEAHKAGYQVVVAGGGDGELLKRLSATGIETVSIASLGRDVHLINELRAFFEILSLIRTFKPDVVHLNSSKAGLSALAGRLAGVKNIIFTIHGWGAWSEDRPFIQKSLIGVVYFFTILLCHKVIVVSNIVAERARFMPIRKQNFAVIHNGVSTPSLLSRDESRKALLPESTNTFWIGVIAELHPIKGLPILIEAYEHFAPDFPSSELVILGEGQERSRLERQIRLEGVSGTTHLVGHVESADAYLSAFDVFVLPSRSEGLPYVLLEAGKAGVPVIATSVGGIPEIIEDGMTGLLVPYGDRSALTEALESLGRNETLRKELGAHLKLKIDQDFSLERMCSETFTLY